MADCKYCTCYHLNSHERLDDSCLGPGDCRKEYFSCNENLKPKSQQVKPAKQSKMTDNNKMIVHKMKKAEVKEYYYEIGVMPTEDIEDGYSLYVKTEKRLTGSMLESLQYLVEKGFISGPDSKDAVYIKPSTKERYDWSTK